MTPVPILHQANVRRFWNLCVVLSMIVCQKKHLPLRDFQLSKIPKTELDFTIIAIMRFCLVRLTRSAYFRHWTMRFSARLAWEVQAISWSQLSLILEMDKKETSVNFLPSKVQKAVKTTVKRPPLKSASGKALQMSSVVSIDINMRDNTARV